MISLKLVLSMFLVFKIRNLIGFINIKLIILLPARSPLIGHINSSLEGLTTIRAFNAERDLKEEFDKHQDLFSSAFLTIRISMLGFSFYMDFISALFTIVVIARFLFFEHSKYKFHIGIVNKAINES